MIVFPTVLEVLYVKAGLFAIILSGILIRIFNCNCLFIDGRVFFYSLLFLIINSLFAIIGIEDYHVGAMKQFQVFVIWPFVYLLLISAVNSKKVVLGLHMIVKYSSILILLIWLLNLLIWLDLISYILPDIFIGKIVFGYGVLESRFAFMSSLPFIIPYFFAVVFQPLEATSSFERKVQIIILLLLIVFVATSGRRLLMLITVISPLMLILFQWRFIKSKFVKLTIFILPIILIFITIKLGMHEYFLEGFYFSDSARGTQFSALIDGWVESPVLGSGHGANVEYIRNSDMPWSYELTYVALLYQIGIIGIVFYFIGIGWIYYSSVKIINSNGFYSRFMLYNLCGLTGMLIANITNPYLVRFDGMWSFFMVLALINLLKIHSNRSCYGVVKPNAQ
jgi:hypothetical protein